MAISRCEFYRAICLLLLLFSNYYFFLFGFVTVKTIIVLFEYVLYYFVQQTGKCSFILKTVDVFKFLIW